MVGIVFARPNSPLARSEIIPQLNDWHFRSGDHIDFYFAGYTYPHPPVPGYQEVAITGSDPWLYSADRFNAFRQEIESRTSWEYYGRRPKSNATRPAADLLEPRRLRCLRQVP